MLPNCVTNSQNPEDEKDLHPKSIIHPFDG